MKIKSIKIENNPILWNMELNFMKTDWTTYDNIILVWENWSWKTSLINIIFQLFMLNLNSLWNIGKIEIVIEIVQEFRNETLHSWDFRIIYDISHINQAYNNNERYKHYFIFQNDLDITYPFITSFLNQEFVLQSLFSDTQINFNAEVKSSTNISLDNEVKISKTDINLAQNINQTLVDVDIQDALELQQNASERIWQNNSDGIYINTNEIRKRGRRFETAFNFMFNECWLTYSKVVNLHPKFTKNWIDIDINSLSSWEKQIVYKWAYFIKDKNSIKWAIWIIDEPEISLHPLWQEKILDYYKFLFKDENNNQTSQLFIATHSPYLLQNVDSETDVIILFPNWERLSSLKKYLWDSPSLSVINYFVFKIPTNELHDELLWYIQYKTKIYENDKLDKFFKDNWLIREKKWIEESLKDWIIVPKEYPNCSLQLFIRNKIHHPENQTMSSISFTRNELKISIDEMISLIDNLHL